MALKTRSLMQNLTSRTAICEIMCVYIYIYVCVGVLVIVCIFSVYPQYVTILAMLRWVGYLGLDWWAMLQELLRSE